MKHRTMVAHGFLVLLMISLLARPTSADEKASGQSAADEKVTSAIPDKSEENKEKSGTSTQNTFGSLLEAEWKEVFTDSCTKDWRRKWTLDGKTAKITHSEKGMDYWAGPKAFHDPDHAVLWTKQDLEGDLKIEYDYTRLDKAVKMVTIIYVQATGSGKPGYAADISKWADKRTTPTMSIYFKNMNTYHISYAAFNTKGKDPDKDYIRARRYVCRGLKGTELKNEYLKTGLFKTGVPHKITIIKRDKEVFMHVKNSEQERLCHFVNHNFPAIKEGKIGLRHMYTRGARYKNFKVSQLEESK